MADFKKLVRIIVSRGESPSKKKTNKLVPDEYFDHYEKLIRKEIKNEAGRPEVKEYLVNSLIRDPSLKDFGLINRAWIADLVMVSSKSDINGQIESEDDYINAQAVIARNLYFQNKPVNEANVRQEVYRLMEIRAEYRDVPIFKGRNVLMAAHPEKADSGLYGDWNKFGKKAFADRIKQDGGNIGDILRPKNALDSLKTKESILKKIQDTPPPFTFIFDGHGSSGYLYLSGGQVKEGNKIVDAEGTQKISVRELFEAYKIRQDHFKGKTGKPDSRDIFILVACYNTNFLRNFYELCDEEKIPKPIFAGGSEYGQFGYSDFASEYNSKYIEQIFSSKKPATLANLIDKEAINSSSNPSIYIPDEENRTTQLAENEVKKSGAEAVNSQLA